MSSTQDPQRIIKSREIQRMIRMAQTRGVVVFPCPALPGIKKATVLTREIAAQIDETKLIYWRTLSRKERRKAIK